MDQGVRQLSKIRKLANMKLNELKEFGLWRRFALSDYLLTYLRLTLTTRPITTATTTTTTTTMTLIEMRLVTTTTNRKED